ncbi:MAG: cupin domain-containing protein [Myxococcota bacterium]
MSSDLLTEVLDLVRVGGSVFCRAELRAPWAVSTKGAGSAIFHVAVRGAGEAVCGDDVRPFAAGDLVVIPHGSPHVLRSGPEATAVAIRDLPRDESHGLPCVRTGGKGEPASILCGTFRFGPEAETLLLPWLPPILHARAGGPAVEWMDLTLKVLADEVSGERPGSELVVARLAEVLLVQSLRSWAASGDRAGWLRALADPQLARALGHVHAEPAADWTADTLARKAGLSRSGFYKRFTEVVGEPPAAWVERWRMALARRDLRGGRDGVAAIAARVGYGSEAAFSRAFKRHVGVSPRTWRKQQAA